MSFFIVIPILPSHSSGAKSYFFFFFTIALLFFSSVKIKHLKIDSAFIWYFFFAFAFILSGFFSKDTISAYILIAGIISSVVYLLLIRDLVLRDSSVIIGGVFLLALVSVLFASLGLLQYHDYLLHGRRFDALIPHFLPSTGVRLSGPFGQPNFHATVILIGLCAFGYLYKTDFRKHEGVWLRIGLPLLVILLFLNFFLTNSRSGFVSLISIVLALFLFQKYLFKKRGLLIFSKKESLYLLLLIGFSWFLYWLTISYFLPQGQHIDIVRGGSIYNRLNIWVATLLMAWDHPWLGIGPDNFKNYLPEYQIKAHGLTSLLYEDLTYTRWSHNDYLQVLAEGGLAAFASMAVFLIVVGKRIWRGLGSSGSLGQVFIPLALIPLLVHGFFEWPLRFAPLLATFLLLIAFALPYDNKFFTFNIDHPVCRGILVTLCCFFLGVGVWAFYWEVQAGNLKSRTGNIEKLAENLDLLEKLSEHPVTALIILKQGIHPYLRYAVRENDVELAQRLSPIMSRLIPMEGAAWQWYNLARVQLTAGEEDEARVSVLRSIDLNPIHEPSWQLLRYLNALQASQITGRPIDEFFPKSHFEVPDARDLLLQHL